jgi:hypothetical protein
MCCINTLMGKLDLTPAQLATRYVVPNGSKIIKPNLGNKTSMPLGWSLGLRRHALSFSLKSHGVVNHPPLQGMLSADVAGRLAELLQTLQNDQQALAYVRKIQFFALNALFNHVVKIYTACNMTHADTALDYLQLEERYAFNKKAYIIEHILDLIQSQLYQMLHNYFPVLPRHLAISAGGILMTHDYGADLQFLLEDQEEAFFKNDDQKNSAHAALKATQTNSLKALRQYLDLFSVYTGALAVDVNINRFIDSAKNIASALAVHESTMQAEQLSQNVSSDMKTRTMQIRHYKPINPALFLYNDTLVHALSVISFVVKKIPQGTKSVPWPAHLVKMAQEGTHASTKQGTMLNYVIAYFKDANGSVTNNLQQAKSLYVNIPTQTSLYEQEIARQPSWLNTQQGIIKIVRACLGDFSQLIDMGILDPCVEGVIKAARVGSSRGGGSGTRCDQYLASIKQARQNFMTSHGIGET